MARATGLRVEAALAEVSMDNEHILQFFTRDHLSPKVREVFGALAREKDAAVRTLIAIGKLLEAKHAAVSALIAMPASPTQVARC